MTDCSSFSLKSQQKVCDLKVHPGNSKALKSFQVIKLLEKSSNPFFNILGANEPMLVKSSAWQLQSLGK